jgi:hypothetical protein
VTPLARPVTWRFLQSSRVPSLAAVYKVASGAPEAQRWAAKHSRRFSRLLSPVSVVSCETRLDYAEHEEQQNY